VIERKTVLPFLVVLASVLACTRRTVAVDYSCSGFGPQSLRIQSRRDGALDSRMLADSRGGLVVHLASADGRRGDVRGAIVDVFADSAHMSGWPVRIATTDSSGFAVLDSIAPGRYWIRSRAIGFRPSRGYVSIRAGALDSLFLTQELDVLC
jgi:hypothetical protein